MEFTVEAGRPDTVTEEKLHILKNMEWSASASMRRRQTTARSSLSGGGIRHRNLNVLCPCQKSRFQSINTDIILGLPREDVGDVEKTLKDIMVFSPGNVTVHTLAIKQSSAFAEERQNDLPGAETVSEMVEFAQEFLFLKKGIFILSLPPEVYERKILKMSALRSPGKSVFTTSISWRKPSVILRLVQERFQSGCSLKKI